MVDLVAAARARRQGAGDRRRALARALHGGPIFDELARLRDSLGAYRSQAIALNAKLLTVDNFGLVDVRARLIDSSARIDAAVGYIFTRLFSGS